MTKGLSLTEMGRDMGLLKKTSLAIFMVFVLSGVLSAAEEVTIRGTVKSIDLNTKTVVVTTYEGSDMPVLVEDGPTLDKLNEGRIRLDDDVKVKYINKEGKNLSTYFRMSAGCR